MKIHTWLLIISLAGAGESTISRADEHHGHDHNGYSESFQGWQDRSAQRERREHDQREEQRWDREESYRVLHQFDDTHSERNGELHWHPDSDN